MIRLLSRKHIDPCPACRRDPDDCPGHDWKALAQAAADRQLAEERAQVKGTPEWRAANRDKRLSLKLSRKFCL